MSQERFSLPSIDSTAEPETTQAPATWLDEAWAGVLAVPFVLSFVPGAQDFVSRGFAILRDDAPGWYLAALGVAVAWGYGRKAAPGIFETLGRAATKP